MSHVPFQNEFAGAERVPRFAIIATAALCLLVVTFVYMSRLVGPSDLFRKDQAKTMAYTVDVIVNGRFSLPRDPIFQPATKPPLYNWLAAAFIAPTGIYDEWAQKLPSIVAALVIAAIVGVWCRRNFVSTFGRSQALLLSLLAGAIFIASRSTILLFYIARPDVVQAACLVIAWLAGHAVLRFESKLDARPTAALFWLATTAAALAKGPAAVYPIVYVIAAAPLIFGSWGRLRNLSWMLGLTMLLGSVGLWLWCAARQDWPHVRDVLLGSEVAKRIVISRIEGGTKPWWQSLQWFITQNTVWSYLMIGSMVVSALGSVRRVIEVKAQREQAHGLLGIFERFDVCASEGFFSGAVGAANLWVIVVVACLSIPKDKRMDFLLPAHPAAAILAAHFIVWLITRHAWSRYALPLVGALFSIYEKKAVHEAKLPWVWIVALGSVGALAMTLLILQYRQKLMSIVAVAGVIGFMSFEVLSNTRLGIVKTSPMLTYVALIAGGGVTASLVIAALRRWRLEWPFIACGILFWSFALLQNQFKDSGLPARTEDFKTHPYRLRNLIAAVFDPGHTSNGTNPSIYASRFATEARQIVGADKVVSIVRSKSPLMTLMGRHQGSFLTRTNFENAKWVIAEESKFPQLVGSAQEVIRSGKLDVDFGSIKGEGEIYKDRVALFRIEKGVPSVDEMISIHRWVCAWTTNDANPYRSANTGWSSGPGDPPIWSPPPGDPWAGSDVKKRTRSSGESE